MHSASGFSASPWAYNGKIFVLSEDGDTYVIQAGSEFKVVVRGTKGERGSTAPAPHHLCGDKLFVVHIFGLAL